jgi:hypothetical protein
MKPNKSARQRLAGAFLSMVPKIQQNRAAAAPLPLPKFVPTGEPRVIIQGHPTGPRPALARLIVPGPVDAAGNPTLPVVKFVPVCRHLSRHVNTRQNPDYIAPAAH